MIDKMGRVGVYIKLSLSYKADGDLIDFIENMPDRRNTFTNILRAYRPNCPPCVSRKRLPAGEKRISFITRLHFDKDDDLLIWLKSMPISVKLHVVKTALRMRLNNEPTTTTVPMGALTAMQRFILETQEGHHRRVGILPDTDGDVRVMFDDGEEFSIRPDGYTCKYAYMGGRGKDW